QGMVCKETMTCPEHGYLFPEQAKKTGDDAYVCTRCGKDVDVGRVIKMSKSKKNVVDPNELMETYGADVTRLFCLFAAPPERDLEWSEDGVEGSNRFVNRVWRLALACMETIDTRQVTRFTGPAGDLKNPDAKSLYIKTHQTIQKVTADIDESFHFNTAIAAVMELVNALYTIDLHTADAGTKSVVLAAMDSMVLLLSPIMPHFCEEVFEKMGGQGSVLERPWPKHRNDSLETDEALVVVQVNGKLRSRFSVAADTGDDVIKEMALADEKIVRHIQDQPVKKIILINKKQILVNIVV
ncbi:MAG: class I tRNA ligase family protein, partial [Desulfotignum sp.]